MQEHMGHARGFAAVAGAAPATVLDLGSGGGLPGLVLASEWPTAWIVLLDAQHRRVAFLEEAIAKLRLGGRVRALHRRAEDAGHDPELRGRFELVTARSFAAPAATAECGAPFLTVGGRLVVSEPPASAGKRWPAEGVAMLGLELERVVNEPRAYAVLGMREPCPARFPRRAGLPERRPLF